MSQLFFVTSQSTDGLENQRMRSHAALVANRQRRIAKRMKYEASRKAPVELASILPSPALKASQSASQSSSQSVSRHESPASQNETPVSQSPPESEAPKTGEADRSSLVEDLALKHLSRATQTRRVDELAAPLVLGMFHAAAAPQGKNYFSFYLEDAIPLCRVIYNPFNIAGAFRPDLVETLVADVLYDAFAAVSQSLIDQLQKPGSSPSYQLLKHRGQAMMKLRSHLMEQNSPHGTTIITIAFLAMLEQAFGNNESHQVHRQVLGKMVTARGGLDALEHDARFTVCEFEMMWALQSGYTLIDYKPHSRVRQRWTESDPTCSLVPSGFSALATAGKLSSQTMDTIANIKAMQAQKQTDVTQQQHRLETRNRTKPFDHYWDAFPCFHIQYDEQLSFEELLEVALIQFCVHRVKATGPCVPSLNFVSRDRLTHYLPSFAKKASRLTRAEQDGLIWMVMVALYAWRTPDHDLQPEGKELRQRAREYPFMAQMKWSSIDETCLKFFWTEDFLLFCKLQWENV